MKKTKALIVSVPMVVALALPAVSVTSASAAPRAKCTKASISMALPSGDVVDTKRCKKGFAGGAASNTEFDYSYLVKKVKKKNGKKVWKDVKKRYCKEKNQYKVPKRILKVSCDVS
jgi:hypothetical protein